MHPYILSSHKNIPAYRIVSFNRPIHRGPSFFPNLLDPVVACTRCYPFQQWPNHWCCPTTTSKVTDRRLTLVSAHFISLFANAEWQHSSKSVALRLTATVLRTNVRLCNRTNSPLDCDKRPTGRHRRMSKRSAALHALLISKRDVWMLQFSDDQAGHGPSVCCNAKVGSMLHRVHLAVRLFPRSHG